MGFEGFCGLLLISAGPATVLYLAVIARKSFLVLLTFASVFYWLVVLLLISCLARGFAPLEPSPGPYAALLFVFVGLEEAARIGLYKLNKRLLDVLEKVAAQQEHTTLSKADKLVMTTAHGFAHGLTHAIFLCVSWLPLTLDAGTYYNVVCPQMSVFLASALLALSFLMIHTSSMVVAFAGAETGKPLHLFGPSAFHLIAALVTLSSLTQGGCVPAVVLSLLMSGSATAYAGRIAWRSLHPQLQ